MGGGAYSFFACLLQPLDHRPRIPLGDSFFITNSFRTHTTVDIDQQEKRTFQQNCGHQLCCTRGVQLITYVPPSDRKWKGSFTHEREDEAVLPFSAPRLVRCSPDTHALHCCLGTTPYHPTFGYEDRVHTNIQSKRSLYLGPECYI